MSGYLAICCQSHNPIYMPVVVQLTSQWYFVKHQCTQRQTAHTPWQWLKHYSLKSWAYTADSCSNKLVQCWLRRQPQVARHESQRFCTLVTQLQGKQFIFYRPAIFLFILLQLCFKQWQLQWCQKCFCFVKKCLYLVFRYCRLHWLLQLTSFFNIFILRDIFHLCDWSCLIHCRRHAFTGLCCCRFAVSWRWQMASVMLSLLADAPSFAATVERHDDRTDWLVVDFCCSAVVRWRSGNLRRTVSLDGTWKSTQMCSVQTCYFSYWFSVLCILPVPNLKLL